MKIYFKHAKVLEIFFIKNLTFLLKTIDITL